jgi:hypothetical protein
MTKLTLSMEKSVVAKAKSLARADHTSVSAMVSQFVISLSNGRRRRIRLGPITRKASGLVKLPPGKDYKELIEEAIWAKHGISK